ncbi:unnamed protein product [Paramecium pentaurelia]|uniref:Transmembrane protein n=1 Tax=Paramecium pentaurelia TaxID=43138 RepID=A0A8S1VW07_9CILI|nr:unnamed protein product [Paramecium pentaurelia]
MLLSSIYILIALSKRFSDKKWTKQTLNMHSEQVLETKKSKLAQSYLIAQIQIYFEIKEQSIVLKFSQRINTNYCQNYADYYICFLFNFKEIRFGSDELKAQLALSYKSIFIINFLYLYFEDQYHLLIIKTKYYEYQGVSWIGALQFFGFTYILLSAFNIIHIYSD